MRFLPIILIFPLLFSCKKEIKTPDFLIGNWKRINNETDKQTYEIWKDDYSGIGFTLRDNDTVFKEELRIVKRKGNIYLKVTGVSEQPTLFKIIEMSNKLLVCENYVNEFPKTITYSLVEEKLKAKIANDDFAIDFIFERME